MEKFNFKLERVLDYKKGVETNKKNEYGKASQKLNDDEILLQNYNDYKEGLAKERNNSVINTSINDLKMYNNFLDNINNRINIQKKEVHKSRKEMETAKDELLEATKEKKMFEKLKEYRYDEYLYSLKKDEEKVVDTIVSYKESTRY